MNISFSKKSKQPLQRGKLIVIDGLPGSGKSTQTDLLVEALAFAGLNAAKAEFPQKESLSRALIDSYASKMPSPEAEAIFTAINHFEAKPHLEQWLKEGIIVVANNYAVGNAIRTGAKKDSSEHLKLFRWIHNLEHEVFGVPKPDLNIVLNMSVELVQNLSKQKDTETLASQAKALKHLATVYPQTKLVSCEVKGQLFTPQEIHNTIWQLVRRIVFKNSLP